MPVALNEPLNMLQRLCEDLEYSELLDKAADIDDPYERMVHVAAFAVSAYANSYSRAGNKPFNPLLGETYECIREDKGFRFIAEQVLLLSCLANVCIQHAHDASILMSSPMNAILFLGFASSADQCLSRGKSKFHLLAGGEDQNEILGQEYGIPADGASARTIAANGGPLFVEQSDDLRP